MSVSGHVRAYDGGFSGVFIDSWEVRRFGKTTVKSRGVGAFGELVGHCNWTFKSLLPNQGKGTLGGMRA